MRNLQPALASLRNACRRFGPYLLLELLLPGGTLMALLLYLAQRVRAAGGVGLGRPIVPARLVAAARWPMQRPGPAAVRWLASAAPCAREGTC
jgi:hypothetical protein